LVALPVAFGLAGGADGPAFCWTFVTAEVVEEGTLNIGFGSSRAAGSVHGGGTVVLIAPVG
jgi:hypothetical protein